MEFVRTNMAPEAIGPYSQAVKAGNLVFCSGQIALKPDGSMAGHEIKAQTAQVMENLQKVMEAAGSALDKAVKTTVFLKNLDDFKAMNEIYAQYFGAHKPARATVEVSNLPKGALVEIECIALINEK